MIAIWGNGVYAMFSIGPVELIIVVITSLILCAGAVGVIALITVRPVQGITDHLLAPSLWAPVFRAICTALIMCWSSSALAIKFSLEEIPAFNGRVWNSLVSLNDRGQIVGQSYASSPAISFVWDHGTFTDLADLGGLAQIGSVRAVDINNRGQVVGNMLEAFNSQLPTQDGMGRAFIWENGATQVIPHSIALNANAINNAGQVAVSTSYWDDGDPQPPTHDAHVWSEASGLKTLPRLDGPEASAAAISENGLVVGRAMLRPVLGERIKMQPYLWSAATGTQPIAGLDTSHFPEAVNDRGDIVGDSRTFTGSSTDHRAFLHRDGELIDLQPDEAEQSSAYGLNEAGWVVGYTSTSEARRPFLHAGRQFHYLDELVESDWRSLGTAVDVNNLGQIVGRGINALGETRSYLLTPIATPGDLNGDDRMDRFDIAPFELALTDLAAFLDQFPLALDYAKRGDLNDDGVMDNFDMRPFEERLSLEFRLAASGAAVPEPSACVLMTIGAAGALIGRRGRRSGWHRSEHLNPL